MADNTIDTLQIELESESKSAVAAIDDLVDSLGGLERVLSGLNAGLLTPLSSGLEKLSRTAEGFGISDSLKDGIKQISGLSKIDPGNMAATAAGMSSISKAVRKMSGLTIPNLDGVNGLIANVKNLENIKPNETGIDKLIRSIKNLATANVSGFDNGKFDKIISSVEKLGAMPDVSASVNRFVSSVARLANAGDKITVVSGKLPALSEALKRMTSAFSGLPSVSGSINTFVSAIAQLANAGDKARKTAENLDILAERLLAFFNTIARAPNISNNIVQMVQALSQLSTVSGKVNVTSKSLSSGFGLIPASTTKAKKGFSGLAGAIGKFYATYWLLLRGLGQFKNAIDISSDLTEVQNVVDVTFGDMADKMNEFAASALQNYGMSELTAKQLGGRFQAMGTSMGIPLEQMSDMSIALTALTGDMASFYNESQESVGKALQSVFTGETEPLRRFGIDLSQATVEAWALSNGLNADMQKMTQAEKTMLRYQFALERAGVASGDFRRTINSWHNQLVLLNGAFVELGKTVGGALTNAFKPFVQALNSVMGSVINFAKVVSEALGAIFGWEYQVGGGMANDLEASARAAGNLDSSMGGAADKAKKMKSYLLGIDELNVLEPDTDTGGSGGSGGAGGGSAGADGGQWVQTEALWEKYTSSIESLGELGEYIGDTLTNALAGIPWEDVYEGARNFGSGLASFLNGLISPELFGEVGTSIAGALNTALNFLDSFGTDFDWTDFGNSIATGINNFFDTFDFELLANTLDVWVQGLWTSITTAISEVEWEDVYDGIKTFLENLDIETVAIVIGALAIKKILSLHLASSALNWIGTTISQKIAQAIASTLGLQISSNAGIGTALTSALGSVGGTFLTGVQALFGSGAAESALAFANPIIAGITGIASVLGGAAVAILNFFNMWENGFSWLNEALMGIGIAIAAVGAVILGAPALVAGVVAGIVATISTLVIAVHDNWDAISSFFTETIPAWWEETALPFFQAIPEKIGEIWESVKTFTVEKWNAIVEFFQGVPEQIGLAVDSIVNWFSELPGKIGYALGYALGTIVDWCLDVYDSLSEGVSEAVVGVGNWFSELPGKIGYALELALDSIWSWVTDTYTYLSEAIPNTINSVGEWFLSMKDKIGESINLFITETLPQWKDNVISFFTEKAQEIANSAKESFLTFKDRIGESINLFITETLPQWKNNVISFLTEQVPHILESAYNNFLGLKDKLFDVGEQAINGLWKGVTDTWENVKSGITDFCDGFVSGFRDALGIHSPSTVFEGLGENSVEGYNSGISKNSGTANSSIAAWANSIISSFTGNGSDATKVNKASFEQAASNAISGFNGWVSAHFAESQTAVAGWASGIIEWFTGNAAGNGTDAKKINKTAFGQFANNAITGFKEWINGHFTESQEPFLLWVAGIVEWFTGNGEDGKINNVTFVGYADAILNAFKEKINSDYESSKEPMETWASKIKEWFWGESNQTPENGIASSFRDFGEWIMRGLIDGIKSLWEEAREVFEDLCDMIDDIVEMKEEINSPSKRFFRYGSYMMQGLINGVDSEASSVYSAFDGIVSGINRRSDSLQFNVPVMDVGVSSFSMGSISTDAVLDSRSTISMEASFEAAIERVIDSRLIPSLRENSDSQNDILREIADKDTNLYMDGRKVNTILNARKSRSGFTIKR